MFEFLLSNTYTNFVGFALLYIFHKTPESVFRILMMPLLVIGLILSIAIGTYIIVPLIVYAFYHVLVPIMGICHQFWF